MWSEKQDPNIVNENVSSQSDKNWCSENSCDGHDFTMHNLKDQVPVHGECKQNLMAHFFKETNSYCYILQNLTSFFT
jgi:hypothetical protein